MLRVAIPFAVTCLFSTTVLSAEPVTTSRLQSSATIQTNIDTSRLSTSRMYDVYVAEPVPAVMYKLEFRYLETAYQEGSDWMTYRITDDYEAIEDGILWIAIHLIAEWRVTEFAPTPQWEKVGSYSSQSTAFAVADTWDSWGYLTKILVRYSGGQIDTSKFQAAIQPSF